MARARMPFQFSGGAQGIVGAVTSFVSNTAPLLNSIISSPLRYPIRGPRTIRSMDIYVITNTFATATTVEIFRDGVGTGMQIVVGSGVTGLLSVEQDLSFENAGLDIRFTCANSGLLNRFDLSAVIYLD